MNMAAEDGSMQQDHQNHSHSQRCLGGCELTHLFRSPGGRGQRPTATSLHARRVPPVPLHTPNVAAITARMIVNKSKLSPDYKAVFIAPAK
jgi:hypothetical protein